MRLLRGVEQGWLLAEPRVYQPLLVVRVRAAAGGLEESVSGRAPRAGADVAVEPDDGDDQRHQQQEGDQKQPHGHQHRRPGQRQLLRENTQGLVQQCHHDCAWCVQPKIEVKD